MKRLYIIAGCNGAGKTTASYTILPEILDCREFVNADEIARGISPFQPDKAGIEAGRLMLKRIHKLAESGESFAFETTLSTKSYVHFIAKAKNLGYHITCLYFWLNSEELAISRVNNRVEEGGHSIPEEVIRRRYTRGLMNLFKLILPLVDDWLIVDNSGPGYKIVADKALKKINIHDQKSWTALKLKFDGN